MNLHGQMINIRCDAPTVLDDTERVIFKAGHRDARHAAAELALKADACIEALRDLVELYNNSASPQNRVAGWLAAREALAAVDGRVFVLPNV